MPSDKKYYHMYVVDWGGNDPTVLAELFFDSAEPNIYVYEKIFTPQILKSKIIDLLFKKTLHYISI